jgi:hypothetical protein
MMKDEGFGFIYKTSIEGKELIFSGYSIVDDMDIIQSGQRPTRGTHPSAGETHASVIEMGSTD